MKPILAFLLILSAAPAKEVLLHRIHHPRSPSGADGFRKIEFRVDDAALKAFGEWEPGGGKPAAVTRNQAVKLALESAGIQADTLAAGVLVSLENVNEWAVGKDALPDGCSPWFYVIRFRDPPKDSKVPCFVVTVGGTLAQAAVVD